MKYKIANTHTAAGTEEVRRRLHLLIEEVDDSQAAKLYAIARRMPRHEQMPRRERRGRERIANECSEKY